MNGYVCNTRLHRIEGMTVFLWLCYNTLTTVNKPAFSCSVGYTEAHTAGRNIYPSHRISASACSGLLCLEALLPSI